MRARERYLWALVGACALHALVVLFVENSKARRFFPDERPERITVDIVRAPPAPPPLEETPPDEPPPEPMRAPPPRPQIAEAPTTTQPAPAPEPTAPQTQEPTAAPPSVVRLPAAPGSVGRVVGAQSGALSPSRLAMEGALDVKVQGPLSDAQRAGANAKNFLVDDLADDAVSLGMADDYFRELKNRVVTAWRPALAQLNDGGERVSQLGFMRDVFAERAAWGEMWNAYRDLAAQYGRGIRPSLEPARVERLRELMRSRKGAFRVNAISEVRLTQAPDGKILLLEVPLPSGHPAIDDGIKMAISEALEAMPEPPVRVHHGRAFTSMWRLRATWAMVPPTALFSGAAFDITSKGLEVDVPFDIKLKTNVMLLRSSTRAQGDAGGESE